MDTLTQAYYQGMSDYEASLAQAYSEPTDESGYSAEELAYYQGLADYMGACGAGSGSPEEAAYYQGIADYHSQLEAAQTGYTDEELAYWQGVGDAEAMMAYTG